MSVNPTCAAPMDSAGERLAIELALAAVLRSDQFRNSQRSSAFLRYVVEQTLQGRSDELKERTIGIAVFGKDDDYDTAADALVRVRANDVRRRLAQYYESLSAGPQLRVELRAGSYVPFFLKTHVPVVETPADPPAPVKTYLPRAPLLPLPPPMAFWQLAAPTAIALFLAIVAIRFDIRSDDAYSRFWAHLLAHRNSIRITLDGGGRAGWISQDLASSALPFSEVAREWQLPIVFGSGASGLSADDLRIELRMAPQMRRAEIMVGRSEQPTLTIAGPTITSIQSAVTKLCSRSEFLLSQDLEVER